MTFTHRLGNGDSHVLVLHGWLGPAASWLPVQPHLDTERFTYAFLDYRGYGARKDEAGAYSMDEIAGDALALADSLGWDRFSVVGHSMGGMAMQKVLALAPARVRCLYGVSPVPASGVPFDEAAWGLFAGAADAPDNRRAIIDFTTGGRLTATWLDATVARSVATSEPKAVSGYLEAWARSDFSASIAGSPVPVKVVAGENDPAISAAVLEATFGRAYPNCEIEVLANAGHYALDELPVALATNLEAHLRTVD
jgi:pimeloyl-ACP methyl ester carboxylesterase